MRSNTYQEQSVALPRIHGHFHRPRLDNLFHELINRCLIVVTAGAGWGKTHGVSAFLYNAPYRAIWFQLSELDNHLARFWEEFIYVVGFQNKETAALLEQMGFPETLDKFDKFLHILANEIYSREQVVLVFDDFHLIYDESLINFTKKLINARLENLCIIINSRAKLKLSLTGVFSNELAGQLTEEDLRFTPEETEDYLRLYGISLPKKETKRLQTYTEGWPLALYLTRLSIKKAGLVMGNPIAGAVPLLFDMIEKEMFNTCSPQIQNFLLRASLLNSFPEGLIKELAGDCYDVILKFIESNTFIYYNLYTAHYSFHHLFLEFLKGKRRLLAQAEIINTYLQAAKWCIANELRLDALIYYEKCGQYGEILNVLINYGSATFPKTTADYLIALIDKFPEELVKNNPITHVLRAGLLLNNGRIQSVIEELVRTQKELEAVPLTENVRVVLGNIYFMLALLSMGSGSYDFVALFEKACEYLREGGLFDNMGKSLNTKYAIMLSSPAPGELKKMEEAMLYAIPFASKAMHGYGHGADYLASAEAAYFTGDIKKSIKQTYEAIYRAREKQVIDVASSGYFLLMRIEALNGNYEGVVTNLQQLRAYVEKLDDKLNFNGMLDVAEGWFYITVGEMEKVAGWIVDDAQSDGILAPYSIGMERLIKAKYMLKEGKYYELLAWLGQLEEVLRRNNTWLMLLDIIIYKSMALHHIQEHEQAAAALADAYGIAHENRLITQFTEHGNEIRSVIYNVKQIQPIVIPHAWMDDIYAKAATYDKHQRGIKMLYQKSTGSAANQSIKLTKREKEMLGYLCKGLTNTEIAGACCITLSAVKKMLNNIYFKLGATNRVDASRIAMQMGLDG